jgi:regulator of cell morphogenesis and NO signaling
MVLRGIKKIDKNLLVSEIVVSDYRTADVFRKYGVDLYHGNKWSLEEICKIKQIDTEVVKRELEDSMCTICLPNALKFEEWSLDFLTDYIIHVHHAYLQRALPEAKDYLLNFMKTGQNEFTGLYELTKTFTELSSNLFPHLQEEEVIIFPYITQIAHAYYSKEPYAGLLVRTLRKPVENVMQHEHELVNQCLCKMRKLTNNYSFPDNASVSHQVVFLKLLELDNDLVQHMHLENDILFPRAIALEKELLQKKE